MEPPLSPSPTLDVPTGADDEQKLEQGRPLSPPPLADQSQSGTMSTAKLFILSIFWFAVNAHWGALMLVLIPSQVFFLAGSERKGSGMALVIGFGAVVALLVPPIFGYLSDRLNTRIGRRRPFMIAGVLVALLALTMMASAGSLLTLTLSFLALQFFINMASAPYLALIPDLVPEQKRGIASGFMGLMMVLGTITGAAIAGATVDGTAEASAYFWQLRYTYGGLGVILVLGLLITCLGVREKVASPGMAKRPEHVPMDGKGGLVQFLKNFWIDPRQHPDFAWVFLMRLMMMLGLYTVQQFLQYYLADVIGAPFVLGGLVIGAPEGAVTILASAILVGAALSTMAAGIASDRIGRKGVVQAAGVLMAFVALVLIGVTGFGVALTLGFVFGIGYGAYMSVELALACDVLPNKDNAAKDMGIWHIAVVLPQVIAVPIAGPLLDRVNLIRPNLGYTVIFLLAVVYFLIGSSCVRRVRGVR